MIVVVASENLEMKGIGGGRSLTEFIPLGSMVSSFLIHAVSLLIRLVLLVRGQSLVGINSRGVILKGICCCVFVLSGQLLMCLARGLSLLVMMFDLCSIVRCLRDLEVCPM